MLKKLPIIISVFLVLASLLLSFQPVFAQNVTPTPTRIVIPNLRIAAVGDTPTPDPLQVGTIQQVVGQFYQNADVTFVGKTANRAGDFLDWTLRNYDWACVVTNGKCSNNGNPLVVFWALVRNIVYRLLVIVVLIAAFVMIITRGRNITIMRFIPRFIFVLVLVTLSYSITQFLYQITDIVQGFFLKPNGVDPIQTKDLIFIGFPYENFIGLRRFGIEFDESAFITLLLVRLTAITYYVMTGILLVRKIILWFFLILSPVFPILLFFRPLRNTGKIWVGEFFRWLLYAPLFALFLHGLVVLWSSPSGIPLKFDFANALAGKVHYPTAVNILIGGPGQKIFYLSSTNSNSVNQQDTFALYVVALLMLWVVIFLPFILLKIFLDYLGGISWQDNVVLKRITERGSALFPKPPSVTPGVPPTPPPAGAGFARVLPFNVGRAISRSATSNMTTNNYNTSSVRNVSSIHNITSNPANTQILQLANLSVPKMRDIAKFETSTFSKNATRTQEVSRLKTSLSRISNPASIASPAERERYTQVREQLIHEKQKGNVLATSILSAANATTNTSTSTNAITATKLSSQTVTGQTHQGLKASSPMNLPAVNKVQEVSVEDYEEVRKMWLDTYQNSTPPAELSGKKETRDEWIKGDIDKINQAITLLNSVDPVRVQDGMDMVSNILPFLMIGGFSKTEVIAYLKAKLEAAKETLSSGKKEDEDTLLERKREETHETKHMSTQASAELPTEETGEKKLGELRDKGSGNL